MNTFNINIAEVISEMPLKEMDGSLLTLAILEGVNAEDRIDVKKALDLAAYLHRGATRSSRGLMPIDYYITHPLRNAIRLMRWGCLDRDVIIATILHDTVEDCFGEVLTLANVSLAADCTEAEQLAKSLEVMGSMFGEKVQRIVAGVTNPVFPKGISKLEKQELWRVHVRSSIRVSQEIFLVKLTDFLDNAGSLHHHKDSNPKMVKSLVGKYAPVTPDFTAELEKVTLLTIAGMQAALDQLLKVSDRLKMMLY